MHAKGGHYSCGSKLPGKLTMKRTLVAVFIVLGIAGAGVVAGYYYRDREVAFDKFDTALFDLSLSIYMVNAIDAGKSSEIKSSLLADVEGNISKVVQLYNQHRFSDPERIRCAVTRKVRALYEAKAILQSTANLEAMNYPTSEVTAYLRGNCAGPPSHEDWSKTASKSKD